MNKIIENRVIQIANYINETKKTIREAAKEFNVSKSTVHKDMTGRLLYIDKKKFKEIEKIFNEHIEIRHIRGGESTKNKYLKLNNRM